MAIALVFIVVFLVSAQMLDPSKEGGKLDCVGAVSISIALASWAALVSSFVMGTR